MQTAATCWCGQVLPVTQVQSVRAGWLSAVVRSSAAFWQQAAPSPLVLRRQFGASEP